MKNSAHAVADHLPIQPFFAPQIGSDPATAIGAFFVMRHPKKIRRILSEDYADKRGFSGLGIAVIF
jgi:hypothetical protein